jgi:hypothetical protein
MTSPKHRQQARAPDQTDADLLFGAQEISMFMFKDPRLRRRIYHLAEQHGLPKFYIGSTICARRSRIIEWLNAKDRPPTAHGRTDTARASTRSCVMNYSTEKSSTRWKKPG